MLSVGYGMVLVRLYVAPTKCNTVGLDVGTTTD
jgi:hypothetical protein